MMRPYAIKLAKTYGLNMAASAGLITGIAIGIAIAEGIFAEIKAREINRQFTDIVDNSLLD